MAENYVFNSNKVEESKTCHRDSRNQTSPYDSWFFLYSISDSANILKSLRKWKSPKSRPELQSGIDKELSRCKYTTLFLIRKQMDAKKESAEESAGLVDSPPQ